MGYGDGVASSTRMDWKRILLKLGLIVAGVLLAVFFLGLVGLADCSEACVRSGEQTPAFAFIGVGVFLATLGILLSPKRSTLRSLGASLFVGALVALAGTAWVFANGGRGSYVWALFAFGALDAIVGGWLAFWRPRG